MTVLERSLILMIALSFESNVYVPKAMNEMPATKPTQNAETKGAIKPPTDALTPSTRASARRAPIKTDLGLCLALKLMTAICVLSPNSESETIANDDNKGAKSMNRGTLHLLSVTEM